MSVDKISVKFPQYYSQIDIYVCGDYEKLARSMPECVRQRVLESTSDGTCAFYIFNSEKLWRRPIIYARGHDIVNINHEILHACIGILDRIGDKINCENDETLAYMQGYALQQYLDKFWDIE